jgi:hypothetical protein
MYYEEVHFMDDLNTVCEKKNMISRAEFILEENIASKRFTLKGFSRAETST